MTTARLIIAVVSTLVVEAAYYVIWRWVLPEFDIQVPLWVLVAVMVFWAVFAVADFIFVTHILRRQTLVGLPTMEGSKGKAKSPLNPEGQVMIKGELWGAKSIEGDINIGEVVTVVGQDGLQLVVRRAGTGNFRMANGSSIR
jgi:membrane-bound serine protease (ClpP class)